MSQAAIEWAGVPFIPMHHHDGRMFRGPGLFCFARRVLPGERLILFAGHADCLSTVAGPAHPLWADALNLGMNGINLNLDVTERLDRLQLLSRIIRHCHPLLNLVGDDQAAEEAQPAWSRQASA